MASSANEETDLFSGVRDYVGIKQLCKIIERSYPATLRMLQKGQIKGYRSGQEWRVKLTEVRRFLDQGNHPDSM